MPRVSHHFVVDRPIEAVFAVVSTARFWPEWHPATRGVEGDIDRPARLGDRITEHATVAGVEGTGVWTVTEHTPPHRLALEAELAVSHLRIAYAFTVVPDVGTRFQRDLDFPELGPKVYAEMEAQSVAGVNRLARLVEREIPAPTPTWSANAIVSRPARGGLAGGARRGARVPRRPRPERTTAPIAPATAAASPIVADSRLPIEITARSAPRGSVGP